VRVPLPAVIEASPISGESDDKRVGEEPRYTLEQVRDLLLGDEVIDRVAEERCIEALYGHWNDGRDFPGREANQKPGVQESWKEGTRLYVDRLLAALDHFTQQPDSDGDQQPQGGGQ
jgi:hypothetical protein